VTSGPLTNVDLQALWRDVTDEGYWRPLVESPTAPLEAIEQAMAQTERLSLAVDRTTQSMYIFPWSGQTDAPSSGEAQATVLLRVTRTKEIHRLVVFDVGLLILHVTSDYGEDGAQSIATGRRYTLTERQALLPGETELWLPAVAERPGTGYNQPLPGTINEFQQQSTGVTNTGQAVGFTTQFVTSTGAGSQLDPSHVSGYLALDTGALAGQLRQIRRFVGGSPVVVELDRYVVFRYESGVGTFIVGELIQLRNAIDTVMGTGVLIAVNAEYIAVELDETSTFDADPYIIFGTASAAYGVWNDTVQQPTVTGTSVWRFLDWSTDLGIAVTNAESPSGGRAAMLDELGFERNVPRTSYEPDTSYRQRVGNPADVVSPNAIRRTANHILAPYGLAVCFRQVGSRLLPGMFYDAGSSLNIPQNPDVNFAYDMPAVPQNRNKVMFDLAHFRGWFKVGVPPLNLGNFGCAYDVGPANAYDQRLTSANFFDGYPAGNGRVWAALWSAIERARMAGVRWDLYIEDIGCF